MSSCHNTSPVGHLLRTLLLYWCLHCFPVDLFPPYLRHVHYWHYSLSHSPFKDHLESCFKQNVHNSLFSSIAAAPPFAGLHWFPEGWHFKQWTGDDSKGLMKVPPEMVQALQAFLDFCYIARQNVQIHSLLQLIWMLWNVSTSIAIYLLNVVSGWMDSPYLDNILLFTI